MILQEGMFSELFKEKSEYKEIFRLKEMLEKAEIPFSFNDVFDGYQIIYPDTEIQECVMDAIERKGSYGSQNDKIEIMGLLTEEESQDDDVVGWLTAENVFERIEKHYREAN